MITSVSIHIGDAKFNNFELGAALAGSDGKPTKTTVEKISIGILDRVKIKLSDGTTLNYCSFPIAFTEAPEQESSLYRYEDMREKI